MGSRLRIVSWAILSMAFCAAACAPQQTLFEDGRSAYSIVIREDATPVELYAAQELQTWIREGSLMRPDGLDIPLREWKLYH